MVRISRMYSVVPRPRSLACRSSSSPTRSATRTFVSYESFPKGLVDPERERYVAMLVESDDEIEMDRCGRVALSPWVREGDNASTETCSTGSRARPGVCRLAPAKSRMPGAGHRVQRRTPYRGKLLGYTRSHGRRFRQDHRHNQPKNRRDRTHGKVVHGLGHLLVFAEYLRAKNLFADRDDLLPILGILRRYAPPSHLNVSDRCARHPKDFSKLILGKFLFGAIRTNRMFFHHATQRSSKQGKLQLVAHQFCQLPIVAL